MTPRIETVVHIGAGDCQEVRFGEGLPDELLGKAESLVLSADALNVALGMVMDNPDTSECVNSQEAFLQLHGAAATQGISALLGLAAALITEARARQANSAANTQGEQ